MNLEFEIFAVEPVVDSNQIAAPPFESVFSWNVVLSMVIFESYGIDCAAFSCCVACENGIFNDCVAASDIQSPAVAS